MPTNLFDQPGTLRSRVSRNLGFDPSAMIQERIPIAASGAAESRLMSRKKFSEDILTQQLQQAAQELQNKMTGYDFSQKQDYYSHLKTPEGQAMWKAYQERMGMPGVGNVDNPYQIHDLTNQQHEALDQEKFQKQVWMHIIENSYDQPIFGTDGKTITGYRRTPEKEAAMRALGIPIEGAGGTNAPAATAAPVTPTPEGGRSAMGVFLNRAFPTGVGSAGAVAAGLRTPGPPWVKALSVPAAYLIGDRITRMAMGDLTPEEETAHPWAKNMGDVAGLIGGTVAAKKTVGPGSGSLGGGATLAPPTIPGLRIKPGYNPPPRPVNINRGGSTGVGQSAARMSGKTPFIPPPNPPGPQPGRIRVGGPAPIPMAQPVQTPPLAPQAPIPTGYKIPMGNQPFNPQSMVSPPADIPGSGLPQPFLPPPVNTPGLPPQPPISLNPQLEKYLRDMMQGPQLPSQAPGTIDPNLQRWLQEYFKRVQPGGQPNLPGMP